VVLLFAFVVPQIMETNEQWIVLGTSFFLITINLLLVHIIILYSSVQDFGAWFIEINSREFHLNEVSSNSFSRSL